MHQYGQRVSMVVNIAAMTVNTAQQAMSVFNVNYVAESNQKCNNMVERG